MHVFESLANSRRALDAGEANYESHVYIQNHTSYVLTTAAQ